MALEETWVIEDEWDGVFFEAEERASIIITWLWFVLGFSSRTRAGNEDFIVIFGGTKSSGIFSF